MGRGPGEAQAHPGSITAAFRGASLWGQGTQGAQVGPADRPAHPRSLQQGKSSSTGNLLDKEDLALPPPDYGTSSRAFPTQTAGTFKQRPYSVAVPAFSQVSAGPRRGPRWVGSGCLHQKAWCSGGVGLGRYPAAVACSGVTPSILSSLRAPEKHRGPSAHPPLSLGITLDATSWEEEPLP